MNVVDRSGRGLQYMFVDRLGYWLEYMFIKWSLQLAADVPEAFCDAHRGHQIDRGGQHDVGEHGPSHDIGVYQLQSRLWQSLKVYESKIGQGIQRQRCAGEVDGEGDAGPLGILPPVRVIVDGGSHERYCRVKCVLGCNSIDIEALF